MTQTITSIQSSPTIDIWLLSLWWGDEGNWRTEQEHSICGASHVSVANSASISIMSVQVFIFSDPTGGLTIRSIHFMRNIDGTNLKTSYMIFFGWPVRFLAIFILTNSSFASLNKDILNCFWYLFFYIAATFQQNLFVLIF